MRTRGSWDLPRYRCESRLCIVLTLADGRGVAELRRDEERNGNVNYG